MQALFICIWTNGDGLFSISCGQIKFGGECRGRTDAAMRSARRIAVLGLYNSGSTAVAGLLHRIGVNMGPPFWAHSEDGVKGNFYEPYDLASRLRKWWSEPRAVARVPSGERIRYLRSWVARQSRIRRAPVGAKHPLLSLCADDLVDAWGPETRFVWSWRPLEQSIAGLQRRGWFEEAHVAPLQQKLWTVLNEFDARRGNLVMLDWARVRSDPEWAVRELASLAGVVLSDAQLRTAAGFIGVR